jgi:drug/metabolite transporter (DMT)-like permease
LAGSSSPSSGRLLALAKATVAVAAWGASFVATKVALRELHPVALVWIRFAMGVVVLGGAVLWRRQLEAVGAKELAYFSLLGIIGITFHQWLQSNGLVTSQATTTGWIIATTPLFIALLGTMFLHERLGRAAIVGILLASLGVLLVVTRGDLRALRASAASAPGDVLILVSAPHWAVFSVSRGMGSSAIRPRG